ncbi:fumarylpyruvate hydrolase [Rhodoblastus acidophilus]|uniref:Fumarylpyruvate hydrolase n=1 Tax=Rhodoblastus acidophilus TaxID=1074 RepID=A0A212QP08_RHOAC|nr:fumarylacetoacetate hydrolase family protein [Rhodoblastus acidophilus]PPQ38965.1 FAA hydrolase family protein [Rhodoblastus acidophilus]RAI20098.1 fumarylacetoacetate hydrolase [Rhodoblastus acidophilus]SNB61089.1 fumarylpyruvate hydrolase [Rhodoblastus acidophilus]
MTNYVIDPPPQACAPVAGGGLFPVRRIFCVGQNYADHAREMGGDPQRNPPFFFTKPADALAVNGADAPYPSLTHNLHHEIELVVALAGGGRDIAAEAAEALIFGYAAGIDLTRRDLQAEAKKAGRPWDMAKGFDVSAPLGLIRPIGQTGRVGQGRISLTVNGAPRQSGDLADMIWSVPEIIAILSTYVKLAPGDLIFTGTPAGVGPALTGDVLHGEIEGVGEVTTRIV